MKRNIKKVADLTQKQYEAALARNGMELTQDGHNPDIDTVSVYGFELTGKTRRAKLAHAIAAKEAHGSFRALLDATEDAIRAKLAEPVETDPVMLDAMEQSIALDNAAKPGDTYEDPVWGTVHVPSHEEEAAATDAARREQDITAPVGFDANGNSRATVNEFPVSAAVIAGGSGNLVDGAVIPSAKEHPVEKGKLTAAVAERYGALVAERGAEVAGTLLQEAIKACGQKIYIDGKVGPYTVRLANRIPEADLLAALNSRAQIGAAEAK